MHGKTAETNKYLIRIYELLVSNSIGSIVAILTSIVTLLSNILGVLSPVSKNLYSGTISGTGTISGPFESIIFHNPSTNTASVLINNTPLEPGFSRSYSADRPDFIVSVNYNTGTQTVYYEYIA